LIAIDIQTDRVDDLTNQADRAINMFFTNWLV
jgi:hypothetical protein